MCVLRKEPYGRIDEVVRSAFAFVLQRLVRLSELQCLISAQKIRSTTRLA
jgi:hypothetical protein